MKLELTLSRDNRLWRASRVKYYDDLESKTVQGVVIHAGWLFIMIARFA